MQSAKCPAPPSMSVIPIHRCQYNVFQIYLSTAVAILSGSKVPEAPLSSFFTAQNLQVLVQVDP